MIAPATLGRRLESGPGKRHRIVIIMLLVASTATAAENPVESREHYERGMKAYNLQAFDTALHEFKTAYVQKADASFLFNIGQCQRQLRHYEEAGKSYRAYLSQSRNPPNRPQVERLIEQMDAAVTEQESRAKQPPFGTQAPSISPLPTTEKPKKWYRSSVAWPLLTIGAASLGIGAGLMAHASSIASVQVDSLQEQRDKDTEVRAYGASGGVLIGVGAASMVAGGIVFIIEYRRARHHYVSTVIREASYE